MTTALQVAGATAEPSSFAPLHINRMTTGLWTNSNPLRDAASALYEEKFYGGRQDRLVDGVNCEISSRLTLHRRAGLGVYNKNNFPPIKRFYSWNTFTLTDEAVKVLADTAAAVYDVTGANDGSGNGANAVVWHKAAGATDTYFLGVGNTLFFTNGKENKQWVIPTGRWTANTAYYAGDRILDPNGNQWLCAGFYPNAITQAQVQTTQGGSVATINVTSNVTGIMVPGALYGTSVPTMNRVVFQPSQLNGAIITWSNVPTNVPLFAATNIGGYYVSVASAGGTSGAAPPSWSGTYVTDNNILWVNQGPTIVDWGIPAPITPPSVSQTSKPNPYPSWAASTGFCVNTASGAFLALIDENGNIQVLKTTPGLVSFGKTGASEPPSWATGTGGINTTTDGDLTWNYGGAGTWTAGMTVSPYQVIAVTTGSQKMLFQNQTVGGVYVAGPTPPNWPPALGATVQDGPNVVWMNVGLPLKWTDLGATCPIFFHPIILDANGYLQNVLQPGKSGALPGPNFKTLPGAITADGTASWVNAGEFAVAQTGAVLYGYEYMNSITVDLSDMSPPSVAITRNEGNEIIVQGPGSASAQTDIIVVFRTLQGGSTFGYIGQLPNPGAGQTWSFTDITSDADVNMEWQAQRAGEGTVLPIGASCLEYHNGHIFAAVGNVVYVSSGPDAVVGGSSGNAGFDTTFTAQSKIIRFWVNSLGVAVFTVRDVYIVTGDGTDSNPFAMQRWISNLPLLNYDAFDVNFTTPYLFTANRTLLSLDPSAGIVEMSFPIADLVAAGFDPAKSTLTYHTAMTGEAAWFLSDGSANWYRLSPINAPDSGFNWNPRAQPAGGYSALQSVEIAPGVRALLVGPSAGGGPIRQRDSTTHLDTGTPYPAFGIIGSIVLANPGQLAALAWITIEAQGNAGKAPAVSLLLNETNGTYEAIPRTHQDPPNLPPSKSVLSNRHSVLQGQRPVWCRHFRMRLDWPAEDADNELLTYTVFGQIWQELRSA
jgi:hypothetical protein